MPRAHVSRFLIAASFVIAAASIGACASNERDAASGGTTTEAAPIDAQPALYGTDEIHSIEVTFDEAAYEDLIEAYADSRAKEWMEADVTIDGTTFSNAGMRLKGNSSLMSLSGSGFPGPGAPATEPDGGGSEGVAASDSPETLPWLIRLDKYEDGQNFGGVTELVVRSSSMETALNEALALDLLVSVGLASQKATYVRFGANGSDPALRLVIENPNDEWDAENFDGSGILYKSEASGNWTYRGDDPEAYEDVFDQETRTDEANLEPLIELLDFLNNSDDATFAAELPDRLDVDAFATYLAFEDLIGNFDDIDGPGNNSYLRYDEGTDQFTVVAWDHNLAFGGMALMGRGGAGGAAPGPPGSLPEGMPTLPDGSANPPGELPEGFPEGGFPQGAPPGDLPEGAGPGGPPGGGMAAIGQNPLVNRFKANADFAALYDAALAEQKEMLFTGGWALERLAVWADLLKSNGADLVDPAAVDEDVEAISAVINA